MKNKKPDEENYLLKIYNQCVGAAGWESEENGHPDLEIARASFFRQHQSTSSSGSIPVIGCWPFK